MATCEICGKKPVYGRSIQHQGGGGWFRRAPKTNRTFKPNVQKVTMHVNGAAVRVKTCTKCLRSMTKAR